MDPTGKLWVQSYGKDMFYQAYIPDEGCVTGPTHLFLPQKQCLNNCSRILLLTTSKSDLLLPKENFFLTTKRKKSASHSDEVQSESIFSDFISLHLKTSAAKNYIIFEFC